MNGALEGQQREPRFLMVCTANICRSPMAEALLRDRLDAIGVGATVLSTGHFAAGVEVSKNSVTAMAERGLDIAGRRSVVTSPKHVAGADVILTMGRSHVRSVLEIDLAAWPRTFPLRVAVRRALVVGPRSRKETLSAWVARLHEGRNAIDMLADDLADEIADPFGMDLREYRATATLLDDLLVQFVSLAFPR
jgi:protein-tyrosine phosphatase